jgi:hypothetical protein
LCGGASQLVSGNRSSFCRTSWLDGNKRKFLKKLVGISGVVRPDPLLSICTLLNPSNTILTESREKDEPPNHERWVKVELEWELDQFWMFDVILLKKLTNNTSIKYLSNKLFFKFQVWFRFYVIYSFFSIS